MSDRNTQQTSDPTNVPSEPNKQRQLKRRSSIGRLFDGIKNLLGLSGPTDEYDNDIATRSWANAEDGALDGEEVDPISEGGEIDHIAEGEHDEFMSDGEQLVKDPKREAIKK